MTHELKIKPEYFQAVWDGIKTFELRKDDRSYQVGDVLILREFDNGYTGATVVKTVSYVLRGCPEYGLSDGYCILGIVPYDGG